VILEQVDGPYYVDIALSSEDIDRIRFGEMVAVEKVFKNKRFYVAALLEGPYIYEEE
jgi:hypothetical protein